MLLWLAYLFFFLTSFKRVLNGHQYGKFSQVGAEDTDRLVFEFFVALVFFSLCVLSTAV